MSDSSVKIENLQLQFHPQCQFNSLQLSELQSQYLAYLRSGNSIRELVEHFMKMGWLVNFQELYFLVASLANNHWLVNSEVKFYFESLRLPSASGALRASPENSAAATGAPSSANGNRTGVEGEERGDSGLRTGTGTGTGSGARSDSGSGSGFKNGARMKDGSSTGFSSDREGSSRGKSSNSSSNSSISSRVSELTQARKNLLLGLPFFRSIDPRISQRLLESSVIRTVAAKTVVCRQGEKTRDLFAVLGGQCGVYKNDGQFRQLVAVLESSAVFGEAGFLLGEPRTADIIALQDSEILVTPYLSDLLDAHLKKETAQKLQTRFWIQHALAKSTYFKSFPSDALDALSFAGQVVELQEGGLLFRQGDLSHGAYVVIQGSLVVQQNGKNINVLNQGDFLGEISLLATQGVRSASVLAQRKTLLMEIRRESFYHLLSQNLYLAKELEALAQQRISKDLQRS